MNINEINSSISINPHNKMTGVYDIQPIWIDDLSSSINIYNHSKLTGYISINPYNKFTVLADIKLPPTYNITLNPTKDAFVRGGIPTLNYGTEQQLMVGYSESKGEVYRSFIYFPAKENLPHEAKVKKAKLKFYKSPDFDPKIDIEILLLKEHWEELGVTWDNQPTLDNIIVENSVGDGFGYVEIDITDLVTEWDETDKENYGFAIKAKDESIDSVKTFYSREYEFYPPELEIEYTLDIIYSPGLSNIDGFIEVNQYKDNEINGLLEVISYWKSDDIICNIDFSYQIPGSITVLGNSFEGSIEPRLFNNINSSLTPRFKLSSDLESTLDPNQLYLGGLIQPRLFNDINCTLKPRLAADSDLSSSVTVSELEKLSTIEVWYKSLLDSSITVKQNVTDNLTGLIKIRKSEFNEISSNIDIWYKEILEGSLYVNSGYFKASLLIPNEDNLEKWSFITIRQKGFSDLSITGETLSSGRLDSSIDVYQIYELYSLMKVKPFYHSYLSSEINIIREPGQIVGLKQNNENLQFIWSDLSYNTLFSKINVEHSSTMQGRIFARQTTNSYFSSQVNILIRERNKESSYPYLTGQLKVRRLDPHDDIGGNINVLPYLWKEFKDLSSELNIIKEASHIQGESYPSIGGYVKVELPYDKLNSSIFIKGQGQGNLSSDIAISGDPDLLGFYLQEQEDDWIYNNSEIKSELYIGMTKGEWQGQETFESLSGDPYTFEDTYPKTYNGMSRGIDYEVYYIKEEDVVGRTYYIYYLYHINKIYWQGQSNITGSIKVEPGIHYNVNFSKPYLKGTIQVVKANTLNSSILIKGNKIEDLKTSIVVNKFTMRLDDYLFPYDPPKGQYSGINIPKNYSEVHTLTDTIIFDDPLILQEARIVIKYPLIDADFYNNLLTLFEANNGANLYNFQDGINSPNYQVEIVNLTGTPWKEGYYQNVTLTLKPFKII